jgi:putative phage-type endonuclease
MAPQASAENDDPWHPRRRLGMTTRSSGSARPAVPLQGTPEWVAWRRGGVGASELPAILGMDRWKGEYQLALLKRGEIEPEPENEAMRWGHRVQRLALAAYAEQAGLRVRNVSTTAVSREYPHVYASLDGRVVGQRRGIEVKLTRERWDGEPPRRVQVQVQAQMGVLDLERVDVVRVAAHYVAPEIYVVERDEAAIGDLLPLAEAWYQRYVLGDELPPVDGSQAASRHLARYRGEAERDATDEQVAIARALVDMRRRRETLEEEDRKARNALKATMAGLGVIRGGGYRVVWSAVKGRTVVDWKSVAGDYRRQLEDLMDEAELAAVESFHTSVGEPGDRLEVRTDG